MTSSPPPASSPSSEQKKGSDAAKKAKKPVEYNARLRGYFFISVSSLINLIFVCGVPGHSGFHGSLPVCVVFCSVTFALSFLIVLYDRTKWFEKIGDYTKAYEGKLEGFVLTFFVIWWIAGVSYQTQVDGIAYLATNIYYSAWICLGASIYTLNQWSTEKDILSIEELTSVSETLASWYILLLGSLVVTGTSIHLLLELSEDFDGEAALSLAFGLATFLLCIVWIFAHYNFFECINEGGWLELGSTIVSILIWFVAMLMLTNVGGLGATLIGTHVENRNPTWSLSPTTKTEETINNGNCSISWTDSNGNLQTQSCIPTDTQYVPGSNLYPGLWICLGASINIALKWKQQKARNFAQAARNQKDSNRHIGEGEEEVEIDEFQDADVY